MKWSRVMKIENANATLSTSQAGAYVLELRQPKRVPQLL